jgi:hypothetical protein
MTLKEYIKQLTREVLEEESPSGDAGGYMTPRAFSPKGQGKNAATKAAEKQGFTVAESNYDKASSSESLIDIVKEELLNEVTYHKFKNEVKFRTKNEQLHKAIREVKRKLAEIDCIVEYTSRMKQELSEGEEGVKYWKRTESNISTISEMVNTLNNKIKNLQQ